MEDTKFKALMDALPPKQQLFVREYLANGQNATKAYIAAGYAAKSADVCGPRLLGNAGVRDAIQAAMDKRAEKLDLTAEKILASIIETRDRCKQGVPVLDRDGNPTGEWRFDASAALKADELLGRHLKLFIDRIEVEDTTDYAGRLARARKRVGLDG